MYCLHTNFRPMPQQPQGASCHCQQCILDAVGAGLGPHDELGHAEHSGFVLALKVPHPHHLHDLLLSGDVDVVVHFLEISLASNDIFSESHEHPVEVVGDGRAEVHGRVEGVALVHQ